MIAPNKTESPEEREKRKNRCRTYLNGINGSYAAYWNTRASIQELTGQSNLASVSHVIADGGAVTESALEMMAKSNWTLFQNVPERILNYGNFAGKVYAGGAAALDLVNAGAELYANGWTGDVTYNLGSAGANALALYSGSPWAKGFARHPAVGFGVGAGAFAIGFSVEYANFQQRKGELQSLKDHLGRTDNNFQLAQQKYQQENCGEFYGN
ncbi:MAG: hypothetical protein Q8M02_15580 [Candidatus Didemnitutus sp.]|nr:hypothetical protein [Candidatus Didemnitutus sp.]